MHRIVTKNGKRVKRALERHPIKNKTIKFAIGKSGSDVVEHYLGMVDFVARNIRSYNFKGLDYTTEDVGGGESGYYPIRSYMKKEDVAEIQKVIKKAGTNHTRKEGGTWEKWVEDHNGDKVLAMKSIVLTSGWARMALDGRKDRPSTFNGVYSGEAYSAEPLKKDAFGLKLTGGRGTLEWGKGYKTISGMNLALAAKDAGYSNKDSEMMVSRSHIMYEASDFLYDHMKMSRKEIFQTPDSDIKGISKEYIKFIGKVRDLLKSKPIILKEMVSSVFGFDGIADYLPGMDGLDTDDDLILVFLLMNYAYSNKDAFEKNIAPLFGNDSDRLKKIFFSSLNDVKISMEGATFVFNNIDEEDLKLSNPCYRSSDFEGIFKFKNSINMVLRFL